MLESVKSKNIYTTGVIDVIANGDIVRPSLVDAWTHTFKISKSSATQGTVTPYILDPVDETYIQLKDENGDNIVVDFSTLESVYKQVFVDVILGWKFVVAGIDAPCKIIAYGK